MKFQPNDVCGLFNNCYMATDERSIQLTFHPIRHSYAWIMIILIYSNSNENGKSRKIVIDIYLRIWIDRKQLVSITIA